MINNQHHNDVSPLTLAPQSGIINNIQFGQEGIVNASNILLSRDNIRQDLMNSLTDIRVISSFRPHRPAYCNVSFEVCL